MSQPAEQGAEPQEGAAVEGLGTGTPAASFGKYQLFASLGRGGMADVFLAVARGPMGFNKLAVIKRLRSNLADDPAFRTMFLDEARLAARLNHPNIVHTYEVGEHDQAYFIAMEYLEGQPLNKVIREAVKKGEVLDQAFCARVVSDALAGLHHAHEAQDYDGRPLEIIHRDVSPHNVFVTYTGQVKLVDFGIAKAVLSSTETEVGVLKGKVAYMSPEQAVGGKIDRRADIFAMGIILWELLTRQRLMTGDSAASTLHRVLNAPIPAVSTVREDIDPELEAIVAKALEKDVRYRFQTAQEMRDALDAFLNSAGKNTRQDEIGRKVSSMFQKVREDVQRQIQQHMEKVTAAGTTEELAALNAAAIKRMGPGGPSVSAGLMKLGISESGSGSGIVPSFSAGSSMGASIPPRQDVLAARAEEKKKGVMVLLLGVIAALLVLVVVILLWVGLRRRTDTVADGHVGDTTGATAAGQGTASAGATTGSAPTASTGVVAVTQTPGSAASAGATAPPTAVPITAAHGHAAGVPAHHPGTKDTGAKPAAPTATAPAADDGFLTLQTYPWTRVSEGGKVLGTTPIVKLSLPPGSHTLSLENPDQGVKQSLTVVIKSGETTTKSMAYK